MMHIQRFLIRCTCQIYRYIHLLSSIHFELDGCCTSQHIGEEDPISQSLSNEIPCTLFAIHLYDPEWILKESNSISLCRFHLKCQCVKFDSIKNGVLYARIDY